MVPVPPLPDQPVAVFDSGVGGLTVLHELLVSLPTEDYIYLGDTARFPYGERSQGELQGFAVEIADHLLELGANGVEAALLLRGLEERAGIDALRDGYERLASSCEKSISASASSTSRF